jgi:hypothetical protein
MLGQNDELQYNKAREVCTKILESNFKIRSASICENTGMVICSEHRKDNGSLTSRGDGQASLIQAAGRFFNRILHEKNFGKTIFSLTLHEKVARIAIPLRNRYVILISADIDTNHSELVKNYIYPVLDQ